MSIVFCERKSESANTTISIYLYISYNRTKESVKVYIYIDIYIEKEKSNIFKYIFFPPKTTYVYFPYVRISVLRTNCKRATLRTYFICTDVFFPPRLKNKHLHNFIFFFFRCVASILVVQTVTLD